MAMLRERLVDTLVKSIPTTKGQRRLLHDLVRWRQPALLLKDHRRSAWQRLWLFSWRW